MSESSIRYFCYGSNLLSDRIHVRLKSARKFSNGTLDAYKLTFSGYSNLWKGATADIVPHQRSRVKGVIWSITYKDLEQLNLQEDGYRLIAVDVVAEGLYTGRGKTECITYVQTNEEIQRGKSILGPQDGMPSTVYKEVIIKGAVEHNLPEEYIEMIKTFQAIENVDCELAHLV